MTRTRIVWIVNHSGHNITPAVRDYQPEGMVCLTEGDIRLDEVDRIKYNMAQAFKTQGFGTGFDPEQDAVLLCGNIVLNAICMMVLFGYFGLTCVRVLIWDRGRRSYFSKLLDTGGIDLPVI